MEISQWINQASRALSDAVIPTPRLDAEIILAATLRHDRTWLHAHSDEIIDPRFIDIANARIQLRVDRVPIAYITGKKEFYGRCFSVSPQVLIPRPDSEVIIDLLKEWYHDNKSARYILDVGTGSGCLGITAKLEIPQLDVTLLDNSRAALKIAEKNAANLGAAVDIEKSNLLSKHPFFPDCIIANLPYVDKTWSVSPETRHEPEEALFAKNDGLQLIEKLITQATNQQTPGGALILEADPRQHKSIETFAKQYSYVLQKTSGFGLLFIHR